MNSLPSPAEAATELLLREDASTSLLDFTEYTFPEFERARHHEYVAEALDEFIWAVRKKQKPRLMIFEPPRHTKSELVSRRLPAYVMGLEPRWQFIQATYSGDFAADFGREVRTILEDQLYQNVFPGVSLSPDSRAANRWHTNDGGIYVSAGVGGPITGRGAHILNIDDPFKDWEEANSETIRESRWNWFLTVARTRLMPGGGILLTQTRWHDDDLAGRLIHAMEVGTGEKYKIISLPALAEEGDELGRKPGEALWPEWYDKEELETIKRALPDLHWNALYQQNPIPETGSFFKRNMLRWYDWKDKPKHLRVYGASDYAVTEDGGDYTEHGVMGTDPDDDLYLIDWWRGQTGPEEWFETQIDMMRHKPVIWTGEGGVIRRAVEPFLRKRMKERKAYCHLEWLPSISDKPTRARGIQARFSMKKIYFPKNAPEPLQTYVNELVRQMMRFPFGVVDDGVDVLSLFGRMLDSTRAAHVQTPKERKVIKPFTPEWVELDGSEPKERSKYRP
jgi:predicted phage terminase large subunit-like protein